jgi:stage V sporulation protein R
VKDRLLFMLTNHGQPHIYVADGNFENRGELLLWHRHEGVDLEVDYARDTLKTLFAIWRRPVNIDTVVEGKRTLLTFDGREHKERELNQMQLL